MMGRAAGVHFNHGDSGKRFMDILRKLFEEHFHTPPTRVQPLQGELGGSGRKIIRLASDTQTAVGILYGVREENVAFLEFSRHFRRHGLPVPEIYAEDLDEGAYLEEDLGDTTLFEFLSKNRSGENIAPEVVEAYRKTVSILPRFQVEAGRDLDYSVCYPCGSFDRSVHRLGFELFQILFSAFGRDSIQRAGPGERFPAADRFSADRAARLFSVPRLSVPQRYAARWPAVFCGLPGRPQRRAAVRHRVTVV